MSKLQDSGVVPQQTVAINLQDPRVRKRLQASIRLKRAAEGSVGVEPLNLDDPEVQKKVEEFFARRPEKAAQFALKPPMFRNRAGTSAPRASTSAARNNAKVQYTTTRDIPATPSSQSTEDTEKLEEREDEGDKEHNAEQEQDDNDEEEVETSEEDAHNNTGKGQADVDPSGPSLPKRPKLEHRGLLFGDMHIVKKGDVVRDMMAPVIHQVRAMDPGNKAEMWAEIRQYVEAEIGVRPATREAECRVVGARAAPKTERVPRDQLPRERR